MFIRNYGLVVAIWNNAKDLLANSSKSSILAVPFMYIAFKLLTSIDFISCSVR